MINIITNGCMLGIGLAMDAFSVSLANGLNEPKMKRRKMLAVSGTFALFQGAMPLIGWLLVTQLTSVFNVIQPFIPWAALVLLLFIGGKMLYEGLKPCDCEDDDGDCCEHKLTLTALFVQGVATSIDALSVGLTMTHLNFFEALLESSIISVLTLAICFVGIEVGKRFGTRLANKSAIIGGCILIAIGFKIFFLDSGIF